MVNLNWPFKELKKVAFYLGVNTFFSAFSTPNQVWPCREKQSQPGGVARISSHSPINLKKVNFFLFLNQIWMNLPRWIIFLPKDFFVQTYLKKNTHSINLIQKPTSKILIASNWIYQIWTELHHHILWTMKKGVGFIILSLYCSNVDWYHCCCIILFDQI